MTRRLVAFFAALALIALGGAWLADRPGEIVLTWQHWQISTSIAVAAVFFVAALLAAMFAWTVLRLIVRAPDLVSLFFRERRKSRGWNAITHGLIAVGTGNLAIANRSASDARKYAGEHPLTRLLAAQAAQLGGDTEKAEAEFRAMLGREETRLLGLRGLYIEAVRRDDGASARAFAQEAANSETVPPWASEALMEFQVRAGEWNGALNTLQSAIDARSVDKASGARRRAVLLTAQAMAVEETDPSRARELAQEAAKLAPDLVPAAALAGRLLGASGNLRKAGNVIEKAWSYLPHPDLARAYAHLRPGDSAEDRLKRAKRLAKKKPDDLESKLSVAQAAIEAHRFDEARALLEPALADPTQRTCLLMAELESAEHGDHGKGREWTVRALRARRDPAWIAGGYLSPDWLPASPHTGQLDAFKWDVPAAAPLGPVLEQAETALTVPASVPAAAPAGQKAAIVPEAAPVPVPPEKKPAPIVAEPPRPDDPGPDPETGAETPPRQGFSLFGWRPGPSA